MDAHHSTEHADGSTESADAGRPGRVAPIVALPPRPGTAPDDRRIPGRARLQNGRWQ